MLFLSRLVLTDFRNYAALTWRPEQRLAVITGPNGSGKTNLLEAISLLGPGRGFSRSKIGEMARQGGSGRWAVAGHLSQGEQTSVIGTGTEGPGERRVFRLDGAEPRSQAELAARAASIWLTPHPAVAASSTGWSGRWSRVMRGRCRRMTPRWRGGGNCWRPGVPIRPGCRGLRSRLHAMQWPFRPRGGPLWHG